MAEVVQEQSHARVNGALDGRRSVCVAFQEGLEISLAGTPLLERMHRPRSGAMDTAKVATPHSLLTSSPRRSRRSLSVRAWMALCSSSKRKMTGGAGRMPARDGTDAFPWADFAHYPSGEAR